MLYKHDPKRCLEAYGYHFDDTAAKLAAQGLGLRLRISGRAQGSGRLPAARGSNRSLVSARATSTILEGAIEEGADDLEVLKEASVYRTPLTRAATADGPRLVIETPATAI